MKFFLNFHPSIDSYDQKAERKKLYEENYAFGILLDNQTKKSMQTFRYLKLKNSLRYNSL